jgi:hypothetical protein
MRENAVLLEEPTFVIIVTETYITTVKYCAHCICLHLPYQKKICSIILVALRARFTPNIMTDGPSFISVG